MRITDDKLSLVHTTTPDIAHLLEWDETDLDVSRYLAETEGSIWRTLHDGRRKQSFAILDPTGAPIGVLELVDIRRGEAAAELRICLGAKGVRGKGLGAVALGMAMNYAAEHLQLKTVYLRVYESNHRAISCYRKVGFRSIARMKPGHRYPESVLLMAACLPAAQRLRATVS